MYSIWFLHVLTKCINDYSLHSQFVSQVNHSSTLYPICCEWSFFWSPFWYWEYKCLSSDPCFDMLNSTQLNKIKTQHRVSMLTLYHCDTSPSLLIEYFGLGGVSRKRLSSAYTQQQYNGFQFSMANLPKHFNTKMALFLLLTQWTSPLPSHKIW